MRPDLIFGIFALMVLFNVPYCTSCRGCVGKCEILKIGRLTVSALLFGRGYCLLHNHDSNEFVCAERPAFIGDIFFPLKTSSFIASKRYTYTKPVLSKLNIISMQANCKDSIKCKFAKKEEEEKLDDNGIYLLLCSCKALGTNSRILKVGTEHRPAGEVG